MEVDDLNTLWYDHDIWHKLFQRGEGMGSLD